MTSISDLKTDGIGGPLQVRILQKWKHDVRRYETWYLAVDRFADAIQILGQRTNQSYIESVLHVSQCYTISDYSCPQLDNYKKFLENEFYIDFGLKSIIQPIPKTTTIPKTWFRFVSKSHLIDLGERPPYYPGPSRPAPPLSGTPSTLYDMKKKNKSDLLILKSQQPGPTDTTPEPSTPVEHVVRTLTYDPQDVQTTYTTINNSRQNMLHDAPTELPYMHGIITNTVNANLDKDTVLMLDMFDMMQQNMTAAIDVCKKITQHHPEA
ncbi:unnamed protein product [Lactuca saligna]|uniref:Uncharacterized protein n=1 Tax=Lactuca saligna TaxID=75948 RepID=A0AA36EL39_LACSI|nr:unnamed protein product [Lactuca saligna]